jgi:O-antigen/teichoic acid export membrane protein
LASLGIYLVAYKLAMIPVDLLMQVINRVALPAYASLYREDTSNCFDTWSANFVSLTWVFAVSSTAMWIGGDYFISLIYGPQWVPPAGVFVMLVGAGLFRALAHVAVSMVLAVNRPDMDAKAKFVETVVFIVLVLLLVPQFGMMGAAVAGFVCYGLAMAIRVSFLISLYPAMGRQLFTGCMRWIFGVGLIMTLNYFLQAMSVPLLVRLGLVVILVLPVGVALEPNLRNYLRLILSSEVLQPFSCRLTALKDYVTFR